MQAVVGEGPSPSRFGVVNRRYVRSQVRLDLSEDDACDAFELELESCHRDNSKKIDETGRRVAKILAKDDTVHQTELLRQVCVYVCMRARACVCVCVRGAVARARTKAEHERTRR